MEKVSLSANRIEINIINGNNYKYIYDISVPETINFGLANGLPIAKALNFASAAAAIAVTRFGAQASLPSLSEVNEMLKEG